MKYEADLSNVRNLLPDVKNVLIALSSNPSVDDLAAGLALFLSLKQAGKEVSLVTEGVIRVGHTNLFGVGQILNKLPEGAGSDFTIVLSGVATPDGRIPAVEKMDYFTTGQDLNLVFKVIPGQKFEPTQITPKYGGGGFDLIFTVGAKNLGELGSMYQSKADLFSKSHLVNIDVDGENARFGQSNIVDPSASSVSEIMGEVLSTLQFPYETDIASNIISGIFAATTNLQSPKVTGDTFGVMAEAMRRGGQKPVFTEAMASKPAEAGMPQQNFTQSVQPQPPVSPQPQTLSPKPSSPISSTEGFDLSKIFQAPVNISTTDSKITETHTDNFTVPSIVSSGGYQGGGTSQGIEKKPTPPQPSSEERPMAEGVETENPEADWLTPKIFKGKGG